MSGYGFPRGRPPKAKKSPSNKNPVPQMAFADAPAFWNTESCAHWTVVCYGNTADWVLPNRPNDPPMSPEEEDWFKTEKLGSWSVYNKPDENCRIMDVEFEPTHPRNRYGVMRLFSIPIGYPACIMPYNIGFLQSNDSRDVM
jgi:hypothetical protein